MTKYRNKAEQAIIEFEIAIESLTLNWKIIMSRGIIVPPVATPPQLHRNSQKVVNSNPNISTPKTGDKFLCAQVPYTTFSLVKFVERLVKVELSKVV